MSRRSWVTLSLVRRPETFCWVLRGRTLRSARLRLDPLRLLLDQRIMRIPGDSSGGASVTASDHLGNHAQPPRQHRTRQNVTSDPQHPGIARAGMPPGGARALAELTPPAADPAACGFREPAVSSAAADPRRRAVPHRSRRCLSPGSGSRAPPHQRFRRAPVAPASRHRRRSPAGVQVARCPTTGCR